MPETLTATKEKYANWVSPKQPPKMSFLDNNTRIDKTVIGQEKRTAFTGIQSGEKVPQRGLIVDLSGKREFDHLFTKEWLIEEVARERQKPIPDNEVPWYHLAGTGFWVKAQVSQLMRNISRAGRENFPEVLERELSKVKVDVIAFEHEYLQQMASLRWNLAWDVRDGEERIIAPDYGNSLLEKVTNKDERDGIVYDTLFGKGKRGAYDDWDFDDDGMEIDDMDDWDMPLISEKEDNGGVEAWLRTAPVNSFAVLVSPKGWSGLKDAAYRSIVYPESQIYALNKLPDGRLQAYTFRVDATIEQNEAFQSSLGLSVPESENAKERIKNTFKNVALITPEDADQTESVGKRTIRSFDDIIDALQDSVGGREMAYGDRSFNAMRAFLKYPERFSQIHPLTEKLISRAQDYARWRLSQGGTFQDIETDLQIAFATIPTQLNQLYGEEEALGISFYNGRLTEEGSARRLWYHTVIKGGINYEKQRDSLQSKPGCANGIEKTKVTQMGHTREGESGGFTCPKCHEPASGPVGDQCPNPECRITKDEFIALGGEAC